MAANKKIFLVNMFYGGISEASKAGLKGAYGYGDNLDFKSDLDALTIQIKTTKDSSTTITAFPKWIEKDPVTGKTFAYDEAGGFYVKSAGTWSALTAATTSHGQGMKIWNDYVYLRKDSAIARYGPLSSSPGMTQSWQSSNVQTVNDHAPILDFAGNLYFANGRYLAGWDETTFTYNQVKLASLWNIRTLDVIGDKLSMGGQQGSTVSSFETGLLAIWDGTGQPGDGPTDFTYTSGAVNATGVIDNTLFLVAGSVGNLYYYNGNIIKVRQLSNLLTGSSYLEIFPGAMSAHRGDLYIGVAGNTDSTTISQGAYAYGYASKNYPRALYIPNVISTGTKTGTGMRIGAICGVGPNEFYVGWKDGSSYGIDLVSGTTPYALATFYSLWFDDGAPHIQKETDIIKFTFKPLLSGESMDFYYRKDRASGWTALTPNAVQATGDTESRCVLTPMSLWKEIQFRVDLKTSGSTAPSLLSVSAVFGIREFI